MRFYRTLCAINYPTVISMLWLIGGFLAWMGGLVALWSRVDIGLGMVAAGAVLIAIPFVLQPWSKS